MSLANELSYAGLRLLAWLAHQPCSLYEMMVQLPTSVSTDDVYLPVVSGDFAQNFIKQLLEQYHIDKKNQHLALMDSKITTIDGLRLDFSNGFGILRSSNTGSFLTVRFSGNDLTALRQIQQVFVDLCQTLNADLAKQIANIEPSK